MNTNMLLIKHLHPTKQLNPHTRRVRQVDHQRNAQVLQRDLPAVLPGEPAGGVDQPLLRVRCSHQHTKHILYNWCCIGALE